MKDGKNIKNNLKNKESVNNEKESKKNKKSNNKILIELKNYLLFYKENLKKIHIIIYLISLFLLLISFGYLISNIDISDVAKNLVNSGGKVEEIQRTGLVNLILKEKIPTTFFVLLAGITPYFYLPVIGLLNIYIFAVKIASIYTLSYNTASLILVVIGIIIQIFSISLSVSMGIYFCKISSKRFRYFQYRSFLFSDLKKNYYEIKKDEKKIKEIEEKIKAKREKIESDNVKIPYKELLITFCISSVIIVIGTLIAAI